MTRQPDSNSTQGSSTPLMVVYENRTLLSLKHSVSCRGIGSGAGRGMGWAQQNPSERKDQCVDGV